MILIAIGSNLSGGDGADSVTLCRRAAARLDAIPGLRLIALSAWYRTAPVPAADQPDYINGVARLRGEADPAQLLSALQEIEAGAGRVRGAPNAARTLDLDIVAMGPGGALVRDAPDPVVPHPRAHLRPFVLLPLLDVAPGWRHPVLGVPAAALLAALDPSGVRRLDGSPAAPRLQSPPRSPN
ncbi:MAG: 2-amino-4-hydroxy-6-hydroxymethyldihydropteridine diphosphokinase [Proteobacteria bacterium]|nr:2-amino-4-hydroxy-6-hydroxymethyldihydropteridine diphosphokinase [Pseudomonadota bacterium]